MIPDWAEHKEDAWEALVTRWVGGNPDFDAVSKRNNANRGDQGTHSGGNRNLDRYMEKLVYTWNDLHLFPVMFLLDTHNISFHDAGGRYRGGSYSLGSVAEDEDEEARSRAASARASRVVRHGPGGLEALLPDGPGFVPRGG